MSPGRAFITTRDVDAAHDDGRREIVVGPWDVVTSEAQERARRLGVRIARRAEEATSPADRPAAGAAPAGAPELAARAAAASEMKAPAAVAPVTAATPVTTQRAPVAVRPSYDLLVRGGRVVLPGEGEFQLDVIMKGGRVAGLATEGPSGAGETLDAAGRVVLPGLVDPHVHLGLFAPLEEDLETETRSALLGGVTTIGCFLGGSGSYLEVLDSLPALIGEHCAVDFFPHLVIGDETQLREMAEYYKRGVTSFKFYMCGIPGVIQEVDDGFLYEGLERVATLGPRAVACVHAENAGMVARALEKSPYAPRVARTRSEKDNVPPLPATTAHDLTGSSLPKSKTTSKLLEWAATHPASAEEGAVSFLAWMAKSTGARVYVVHVSSASGLEAIREARAAGALMEAEVASPYLLVTWDAGCGSVAKMVPPFRAEADREALWRGISEGLVATLGTDNVTIDPETKGLTGPVEAVGAADAAAPVAPVGTASAEAAARFAAIIPGYPGLATHLAAVLTEGVSRRGLALGRLAELTSRRPSEVFGLYPRKGTLLPGSDADAVVVDLGRRATCKHEMLGSRAGFSLYEGAELVGWPFTTIRAGRVVVRDGRLEGPRPGRLLLR